MANHQPIQIQRPIFRQNKDDKGSDKSSNHEVLILEYEFIITGVESLLLLCDERGGPQGQEVAQKGNYTAPEDFSTPR